MIRRTSRTPAPVVAAPRLPYRARNGDSGTGGARIRQMTALAEYARLESTGIWRPSPEAQRERRLSSTDVEQRERRLSKTSSGRQLLRSATAAGKTKAAMGKVATAAAFVRHAAVHDSLARVTSVVR